MCGMGREGVDSGDILDEDVSSGNGVRWTN